MSVGARIRANRVKNAMSQKELADLLFVTPQTVSKWENDLSEPSFHLITEMTKIFHLSHDELFTGDTDVTIKEVIYTVYKDKRIKIYYDAFVIFLVFLSVALLVTTAYVSHLDVLPMLFEIGFSLFSGIWIIVLFVVSRWRLLNMESPENLIYFYQDKLVFDKEELTIYNNQIKKVFINQYSFYSGLNLFDNTGYLKLITLHNQVIVVRDILDIGDLKRVMSKIEIKKGEEL